MQATISFAAMNAEHWPAVARIYREGIATGHGTFEANAPGSFDEFIAARLAEYCWVALIDAAVAGFVVLSAVSKRPVYRGVAELGIYVAAEARGQGVGSALLGHIIELSEAGGLWTLQASLFPENTGSLALHQKFGFRLVGRREQIGLMTHGPHAGQWRDTLLLERRSRLVGV